VTALYTSNIQKGGALLDDARRLVEVWDQTQPPEKNLERISEQNLLGKTSRSRADDILLRVLRPRYVEPGPQVIAALSSLLSTPRAFADACYFEASRDDALLAAFAEGPLFDWFEQARVVVRIEQVTEWLAALAARRQTPPWSDTIRTRVARGLLAALRDFGVLRGAIRKEFNRPHLTLAGFAYVAFRLHEQGASSRALLTGPVWRRWLLDRGRVTQLFAEADRHGILRYSAAGSAVRIDWLRGSLEEVTRAAA